MLAANLTVCHYPGMPGQSNANNNISGSNNNLNVPNDINGSNSSNLNSSSGSAPCNIGVVGSAITTVATKNQLEQLNTMREALFSQDGWGCQHVNQDTNWEVPSSPEPTVKDPSAPPLWKPNVNNGTELWESTLRNGGQPPAQSSQKTPWGHTPSSNLGGTWGEDDDGVETNSVWTGSTSNPVPGPTSVGGINATNVGAGSNNSGAQWTQSGTGLVNTNSGAGNSGPPLPNMSSGTGSSATGSSVISSTVVSGASGWVDPRGSVDLRNVDPRDQMRASSAGDPRDIRLIDPRDPIRGDPRGISGRLNGSSEMWGQHHAIAHSQISALNKIVGQGTTPSVVQNPNVNNIGAGVGGIPSSNNVPGQVNPQWGNSQPVVISKDISNMSAKNLSGWEEPSPPTQRRNIPNYDDGTSLWGQQHRISNWKDIPENVNRSHLLRTNINSQNSQNVSIGPGIQVSNNGANIAAAQTSVISTACGSTSLPTVGPPSRIGPSSVGPGQNVSHKQESGLWVQSNNPNLNCRNTTSWDDGNHNIGNNPNWVDDKANTSVAQIGSGINTWNDTSWGKTANKIPSGVAGWGCNNSNDTEVNNDWNSHGGIVNKPPPKLANVGLSGINSDIVKQSKQYRYLVENGFKKEDVERALVFANMNIDDAAEILRTNAIENWRRHDDSINSFVDHNSASSGVAFPGRYNGGNLQSGLNYPQGNILNNISSGSIAPTSALNALQVPKFPHNVASQQSMNSTGTPFGQGTGNLPASQMNMSSNSNNQPSTQQLRMLVQQIQMAVHNGYLSSQILNQPLAPTTLVLLNQLLSSIKHLQTAQQSLARTNSSNNLQINVAIAKHKQQIQSLQNQINMQQANYIKQQQNIQQQAGQSHSSTPHLQSANPDFLRAPNEAINNLQSNFSEISLNKPANNFQSGSNQQSRLNQWKLPSLDKEENTEFSRAPGATKQPLSGGNSGSIGHLGLPSEGTWSSNRNIGDGWPDVTNDTENKDWSVAPSATATSYSDLVQEFEPGKPWKGSQLKSIEDDPSMTPGSVVRSPLSINPGAKDSDIFTTASKTSPTDITPLGLGSSTWSFNPPSANPTFSSWTESSQQCGTSELWTNQMNKSARGPPPGLVSNKGPTLSTAVSVAGNHASSGQSSNWLVGGSRAISSNWTGTTNPTWNSSWLLLKNLTAQIDGSTLRTLCMQHGHPVSFHLYLNQGFALCKYATHEEASKAQMTLNNCVLSNTTICAESPSESEVQNLMKHLPQTSTGQGVTAVTNCAGNNANGNLNSAASISSSVTVSNSGNNCSSSLSTVGSLSVVNSSNPSSNAPTISNNISNAQSTLTSSSGVQINSNSNSISSSHNNWRQPTQNQQQNQSRSTGRETDFDYISKYVCSIVDD